MKPEDQIRLFEDGLDICCKNPSLSCVIFPDTCMCTEIKMRKVGDGKACTILVKPEVDRRGICGGSKPVALEELKLEFPKKNPFN